MRFTDFLRLRVTTRPARARADYHYLLLGPDVLIIFDQDLGNRSVTNDIEAVLAGIAREQGLDSLRGHRVAYRDSDGLWTQVGLNKQGFFERFFSFGKRVTDDAEAVKLLHLMRA